MQIAVLADIHGNLPALEIETGKNIGLDFVNYAYSKTQETGILECDVVPDDIWELADKSYPWDKARVGLIPNNY